MTLHEAIEKLLKLRGRPMTTSDIAEELNRHKWYTKKDSSKITAFQIHGRTRNYLQLFKRTGSLVSLVDQPVTILRVKRPEAVKTQKPAPAHLYTGDNEQSLMDTNRFQSAGGIDSIVPHVPGIYCIRIRNAHKLPAPFSTEQLKRGHNIIYIGKASQSLHTRFLGQELRARGHGTFFRSIGAVLGYKPPKGSLIRKKNKRNFKFSHQDEAKIISWINDNLLVNWVQVSDRIPEIETYLIKKYRPLLNLDENPLALSELKQLREKCKRIANSAV